ncbi:biotin-dependent carboxyltransferase family protein [Pseudolysobacter antarcticus]|uniref:Biotin-dependent carboxyltransferase family protein n=1 Tax=Pseudolysobacter antarcticus TaxID=2511995 RepID=A0A411HLN2_9GAMM|nr:biotin-dependent carboxyltransferase family protein [Pseudolysobacter antarcticus]QBB71398.1 biotin-dependent carboxyltransferase family protein [Pseudolysobacter antarcticus]
MSIEVLKPGLLSTLQDGGRHGSQHLGVGCAGAMDANALRLANYLVGNQANAVALEITLQGPRLRFETPALIALTGANIEASVDQSPVPLWRPIVLRAGSELVLGGMHSGARSYLAVAGGFDVASVLGSGSADINAALGSRSLQVGTRLDCKPQHRDRYQRLWSTLDAGAEKYRAASWWIDPAPWFDADPNIVVHTLRGAHFAQLDIESQRAFFAYEFRIGSESNRVGYRLQGPNLQLAAPLELISEGLSIGTVQLPPSGNAIVLMAEHPTTGGYPRIGHVASADLAKLAQARPGQTLRFVEIDLTEAQKSYLAQQMEIERLRLAIADRLHD